MHLLTAFLLFLSCLSSMAVAAEWHSLSDLESTVETFVREKTSSLPGDYSINVTHIDTRLKLAKCEQVEAWLPASNRLWGQTSIGVRCNGPTVWSLFVPVFIKVNATVLVAARPISSGQSIEAEDLATQKKDVTSYAGSILSAPAQAIGKKAVSSIQAGTVLRSEMLRAPMAILQGQQVKLVAQGAGFKITSEGQAMGNAALGQVVSVKTRSGQVIKGIAKGEGIVEVYF